MPPLPPEERERALGMHAKGQELLERGQVYAARKLFERAAEIGLAQSAVALAATYDPDELAKMRVMGLSPDAAAARKWYEKARELGAPGGRLIACAASARRADHSALMPPAAMIGAHRSCSCLEDGAELLGRAGDHRHVLRLELGDHRGIGEHGGRFLVNPGQHGIAGAGRRDQADPGVGLDVGDAGLAQGRQLRQQRLIAWPTSRPAS